MGIEILEASAERIVGTMPVEGNMQPFGLLHGGASCVLAETLGSIGATLHAHPDGIAVGVDINATHHRAVARASSPASRRRCIWGGLSPATRSSSPTSRTVAYARPG